MFNVLNCNQDLKGGEEMRPRRYPYSGQKEPTFIKADPKLVENALRNTSFSDRLQVVLATKL